MKRRDLLKFGLVSVLAAAGGTGFFSKAFLGRGLAAPQVGIPERLIVCGIYGEIKVLINPDIIETRGVYSGYENCLSVPHHDRTPVKRPAFIKVRCRGLGVTQK
jgi:peptide deformylase